MPDPGVLARLAADGYLRGPPGEERTTPRWQAAMARASLELVRRDAEWSGLKVPVAVALLERYPHEEPEVLAALVEAMSEVEGRALATLLADGPSPA